MTYHMQTSTPGIQMSCVVSQREPVCLSWFDRSTPHLTTAFGGLPGGNSNATVDWTTPQCMISP